MTPFIVVIPARFGAKRLPGKPLVEVGGMPLLRHAHQAALGSEAEEVIIATDDERIEQAAKGFGAKVAMTSPAHRSGTERIAEVATRDGWPEARLVVNVQGDEVGLPPALINQVAANLAANGEAAMATLCEPIRSAAELRDPSAVKVVFDHRGQALFFSRSPIPWQAPGATQSPPDAPDGGDSSRRPRHYRHIGVYAYTCGFLKTYASLPPAELEQMERLEQLRALHYGFRIHVQPARKRAGFEINTPEDLERAGALGFAPAPTGV